MKRAILAIDQAVGAFSKNTHTHSMIGWAVILDGDIESFGEVDPDPPNYISVCAWLVDAIGTLKSQGYDVTVAIETVYAGPNRDVSLKLSHIQGYVHGVAISLGVGYQEVTPLQSQKRLTGVTSRVKSEDRKRLMVEAAERLMGESMSSHEADAIGIGLFANQTESHPRSLP